jgi:hypothetical protein
VRMTHLFLGSTSKAYADGLDKSRVGTKGFGKKLEPRGSSRAVIELSDVLHNSNDAAPPPPSPLGTRLSPPAAVGMAEEREKLEPISKSLGRHSDRCRLNCDQENDAQIPSKYADSLRFN